MFVCGSRQQVRRKRFFKNRVPLFFKMTNIKILANIDSLKLTSSRQIIFKSSQFSILWNFVTWGSVQNRSKCSLIERSISLSTPLIQQLMRRSLCRSSTFVPAFFLRDKANSCPRSKALDSDKPAVFFLLFLVNFSPLHPHEISTSFSLGSLEKHILGKFLKFQSNMFGGSQDISTQTFLPWPFNPKLFNWESSTVKCSKLWCSNLLGGKVHD